MPQEREDCTAPRRQAKSAKTVIREAVAAEMTKLRKSDPDLFGGKS